MTYPVTQRSIPELGNPQPQRCENVKIRVEEKFENVISKTVEWSATVTVKVTYVRVEKFGGLLVLLAFELYYQATNIWF
jgi:hypothetical protein